MASAKQKRAPFIAYKLKFLKDQGELLIGAVRQYVSGIITAGETWTEGGDNKMDYMELCQMIDSAVDFLSEKCEELAGSSVEVAANQLSRPPYEQSHLTSKPATSQASPPSYRQHTEPVQPADEMQLKPVLARIAVIEDALCLFRTDAEKVPEQQSYTDQQLKEVLSKLSESEKKQNSKLQNVKEQISEINDTEVALHQEQETRLQSLEKKLKKLSTAEDRMKAEMKSQTELTEKQLQKLSTAQDRMKAEMESQTELTEKLVHVPDQLESVKQNLGELDARIVRIMDDCSNKHQDIEHVTHDLADKVIANTESVKVISADQDQKTTLLRELETRMQTLEADRRRNVEYVQKQLEKGVTNLRILCQMLNDRLTPLEQLRTCLNERASARDDNIRQLTQVIQKVAVMFPRLQQIELKSSRTRCGFTARARFSRQHIKGDTVKPYTNLLSNIGGNFNAGSGIFTAPVDGLYVAAVSVILRDNEYLEVGVEQKQQGQGQSSAVAVCVCSTEVKDTQSCNVGVVDMKAGDILFAEVYTFTPKVIEYMVFFSCFLLA